MRTKRFILGAAAMALALAPAQGLQANPLEDQIMYGFDRNNSDMWRYDFSAGEIKLVGKVRDRDGNVLLGGIDAAAYAHGTDSMPGYDNIIAFRWDAAAWSGQMLYVDKGSGVAGIVNSDLEGGRIGGATAVFHDGRWNFYAVQHEKVSPPFYVDGTVARINPNNAHMSFELVMDGQVLVSRADLLAAKTADLDENGTLFEGEVTRIRVRPMGNGNNNTITITLPGQQPTTMQLRNSNTYVFEGNMMARLYNPQMLQGGNSMGNWHLEMEGSAHIDGDVEVLSPNRLIHVSQFIDPAAEMEIGTVTEIIPLSRAYDSLASQDGVTFYAGYGNELWRITPGGNPVEQQVNSKVANPVHAALLGMDFISDNLYAYEVHDKALHLLDASSGNRMQTVGGLGWTQLGTILFCPKPHDRHHAPLAYD